MGKASLIIVLGFAVSLGIISHAITGRLSEAVGNSAIYVSKTRAKNIASSVAEIYIRKMKDENLGVGSYWEPQIMGGTATATISSIDLDPATKPDTLKLFTVATYDSDRTVWGEAIRDTVENIIEKNISINEPLFMGSVASSNNSQTKFTFSNNDTIDGRSRNLSGALDTSGCPSVNGLVYGNVAPTFAQWDTSHQKIYGSGASPDTQRVASEPNYDALALQLTNSTFVDTTISTPPGDLTIGDTLHPKITLIQAKVGTGANFTISNTTNGAGILLIDLRRSNVTFSGALNFRGVIFVIGDTTTSGQNYLTLNQTQPILGTIVAVGKYPWIQFHGKTNVYYSCDAIEMAFNIPKLQGYFVVDDWWE